MKRTGWLAGLLLPLVLALPATAQDPDGPAVALSEITVDSRDNTVHLTLTGPAKYRAELIEAPPTPSYCRPSDSGATPPVMATSLSVPLVSDHKPNVAAPKGPVAPPLNATRPFGSMKVKPRIVGDPRPGSGCPVAATRRRGCPGSSTQIDRVASSSIITSAVWPASLVRTSNTPLFTIGAPGTPGTG